MRLLLQLCAAAAVLSLAAASCCTPECCCPGCTSCNNPINDRCNSYSCTYYAGNSCGSYQRSFNRLSPSSTYVQTNGVYTANGEYVANGHHVALVKQGESCNCKTQPLVPIQCVCPSDSIQQQGSVIAISGTGTRVVHKESCYGYDYCLLGLPGWVTIICSILLLLIFIILLFYCISCLVHYLII